MSKGMEEYTLKIQVETAIEVYKSFKMSDDEIVRRIIENYPVDVEYVNALMKAKSE